MSHTRSVDIAALIQAIEDSGLSKTELARRSGVSLSHIKYVCAGTRGLNPRTAAALAEPLGVDVNRLYHTVHTGDAA